MLLSNVLSHPTTERIADRCCWLLAGLIGGYLLSTSPKAEFPSFADVWLLGVGGCVIAVLLVAKAMGHRRRL